MFISEKGSGFPVVLIHGFCENQSIWSKLANDLAIDYRIILIDLPGFGNTNLEQNQISIDSISTLVHTELSDIGIKEYIPIGHSLGGYITLALEDLFSESIKAYGLFHSTAFADTAEKKEGRNQAIRVVEKKGPKVFLNNFYQNLFYQPIPEIIQQLRSEGQSIAGESIVAYAKAMKNRPDRSELLKSGKPKLILAGREDGAVPFDDSMKLFSLAVNCDSITLNKSGHMGMFEEPEKGLSAVQNFLKRSV